MSLGAVLLALSLVSPRAFVLRVGSPLLAYSMPATAGSVAVTGTAATLTQGSGGGISPDAFFVDEYDDYTNTTTFRANQHGRYNLTESLLSNLSIDTSVQYNGHQTVKVTQTNGSSGIGKMTVDGLDGLGISDLWIRWKMKFSSGWTTDGSAGGANSWKVLGITWDASSGRGDLEITNTDEYQLHHYQPNNGTLVHSVIGDVANEWTDGNWYDYILHYKRNSSTSILFECWRTLDGNTPTRLGSAWNGSPAVSGFPMWVGLPFYFNQTLQATQSLWIGQWEMVNGADNADPFGVS